MKWKQLGLPNPKDKKKKAGWREFRYENKIRAQLGLKKKKKKKNKDPMETQSSDEVVMKRPGHDMKKKV